MRRSKIIFLILLVFSCCLAYPQSKSELEKKKKKTIEEINYTNKLLKETQKNQKESENNLMLIKNQINSRQELIQNINAEIKFTQSKIKETEQVIDMLEEDLEILKSNYAQMIRVVWKNQNKNNDIMFILSSKDFNQIYLRYKYMQQMAQYRQKQFAAINYIKDVLQKQISKLNAQKLHQDKLLVEEKTETQNLESAKRKQETTLTKLQSEEQSLRKKLQEKNAQMTKLQNEIAKIIAEEAKRSSKGKTTTGKYELTPEEKIINDNFGSNVGKLPWPVQRGVIVGKYGKQPHPVISGIEIDNKGIDISTTSGSDARAVFDGEVRKVFSIPGMQNAIIIRHGDYMSVYTHIETVYVTVGDKVTAKQPIGKIYTDASESKTILHFEIWKASVTQNPSSWLAK